MSLSPNEFWTLLRKSELLPEGRVDSLERKIAQKESVANSTSKIVRTLVANKILTEDQLRHLISVKNRSATEAPPVNAPPVRESRGKKVAQTVASQRAAERSRRKSLVPIVAGVTGVLFLGVALGLWFLGQNGDAVPSDGTVGNESSNVRTAENSTSADDGLPYEFVDSDDILWGRPDPGSPVEWQYVPEGTQVSMRVRLAACLRHPEGSKILRSLGPDVSGLLQDWKARTQVQQADIQQLDLHLLPQGSTMPTVLTVATLSSGKSLESVGHFGKRDSNGISSLASEAIWFPDPDGRTFVVGPNSVVSELANSSRSEVPRLRRELAHLQRETHSTDHVTVLANPNFLRDEAQGLFPNERRRLLDGLFEFWSDEAQAVSIGLQLSQVAVVEVRMIAREDLAPRRLAGRVKSFVAKLPTQTGDFLGRAQLDSYWQPLALRFPSMLRMLDDQTRIVTEGKQVAMNVALPNEAIHNLLLATELSSATPASSSSAPIVADRSRWTIKDVLSGTMSVRFAQKSLEQAMDDVAEQVREEFRGVPFEFSVDIIGTDLEPEGITRNQQIRNFAASGATLREALTQLVMKANPTPGITDPTVPEQKLIWVIGPSPGKILITTRAAAAQKQLEVPAEFGAK